jgi:hypothetical protein
MKHRNTASLPATHCQHISRSGRPCRYLANSPDSHFCQTHSKDQRRLDALLAAELYQAAGSLDAPQDVLPVLSKVFLATTQDQITPRKAAVLGYLGQMLLRAHREIAFHQKIESQRQLESGELTDIFDVPRPIRDDPPDPPKGASNATTTSPSAAQPATTANPASSNHYNQSFAASNIALNAAPAPPPQLTDLRHFYHYDPTLPPGTQDINNTIPPELRPKPFYRWRPPKRRHHYP